MPLATGMDSKASLATTTAPFAWAFGVSLAIVGLKGWQGMLTPQFWAEDGNVFFVQQQATSWPLLFEPYAGYLNLVPRAVAWFASLFSATHAPAIYAYTALAIGAAALASLRHAAARADLHFLILLAAFAAMPVTSEVVGRLTNVQWLLQFHLLGVAVACRLGHRSARPLLAVAAVLASSLTGPFAIFSLAGLAAAEVVVRITGRVASPPSGAPRWWMAPELLAMIGGAALQVAVLLSGNARVSQGNPGLIDLGQMVEALQSHPLVDVPLWPEVFAAALIGVAFAAVLSGAHPGHRRFAAIILMVVVVQLAATASKFAGHAGELVAWQNGDRYFALFRVMAWWLLLLALLAVSPLGTRWVVGVFLALLGMSVALVMAGTCDSPRWTTYNGNAMPNASRPARRSPSPSIPSPGRSSYLGPRPARIGAGPER